MTQFIDNEITSRLRENKEYLDRCQVDTPHHIVKQTWNFIKTHYRKAIKDVVDFGAGDGRFSLYGDYISYTGIEIDNSKNLVKDFPKNARMIYDCAFSSVSDKYDVCIGNPPYVRHHDINNDWQHKINNFLSREMNITLDKRGNAFLYFLSQALLHTHDDGLIVLIIPFEWVSRPSAKPIRDYIESNGWKTDVFHFKDTIFPTVLTTASLTIIDKRSKKSGFSYFDLNKDFSYTENMSPAGDKAVLRYAKRLPTVYAQRGMSPGNQKAFCLTEEERQLNSLIVDRDVIPCITSLKNLEKTHDVLDMKVFNELYRDKGMKCWLIKSYDSVISTELANYLNKVDPSLYGTATCKLRNIWWEIKTPIIPNIIYSASFTKFGPKAVINEINAATVGGAYGIYGTKEITKQGLLKIKSIDFESQIVNHSGQLKKIEVNQMNAILQDYLLYND